MNKKSNIRLIVSGFGVWIACFAATSKPQNRRRHSVSVIFAIVKKTQYLPNKLAPEISEHNFMKHKVLKINILLCKAL